MNKKYSESKINLRLLVIRSLLIILCFFATTLVSFGQTQNFNASGNFIVPPGVTSISVQAWGAGGAGGGSTNAGSNIGRGGAGGGGGAYATVTIPVTPGAILPVVVGAGGTGASGVNGNPGGNSTITGYTGLIFAQGGRGGIANTSGGSPAGGVGGTVAASIGAPIAGFNGINGATATSPSVASSGAGGAGANSGGAGGAGIGTAGTTNNGNSGVQPGGGGGGARTSQNVGPRIGGAGGAGRVIITWTCPPNAGTLSGDQFICTYGSMTTTLSSTVSGGTWSTSNVGIATVNATTGVVTGVSAGTATISYTITSSGCTSRTATRDVYVTSGPGAAAVISGSTNQCQNTTANYSVSPVAGSYQYIWSYSGTGATITPSSDGLSASIAFSSTSTSGNILVRSINSCGSNNGGNERFVTVGALPTAGSISGTTSVCISSPQPNITFTNPQNYGVTMTYNVNGGANQSIYVNANTTSNLGISTATAGTFTYNLVSITNGVGSPTCASPLTGSATVTVGAGAGDQVTYGAGSWIGYVYANTDGGNPPSNAFSTTYRGYITQPEIFNLDLVDGAINGPNLCGSYTNNFAVRYKMTRNLPAGCYTFTVGGDDGYRLSLDGGATFVVSNWDNHAYESTIYTTYLSGNTNFVLEYFETGGQSRVSFSYISTALAIPTVGVVNNPTCTVPSGSVPLSGLPTSGPWTIIASPTAGLTGLTGTGGTTTVSGLVAGTTYTFAVSNGTCTSPVTSNVVINAQPTTTTVTSNKVDETCSSSNNGIISPTLSGGLTNVRYIKLTQKYNVDAYQQVAEIQAFEIFTGTNVALSTFGSVATGSSVWQGSSGPNYIPSNVNNGVITGSTFWHSVTSNMNEWVQIDLQSGKNLDNIRVYNRTDCCSARGQNMLLELFDGSNNLVYSKNIDLYQSGANVVDLNVLDLSWADGATTLNRTGLDSGTYILNYADAVGCSVSSPIIIGATALAPVAPVPATPTHPTCAVPTGSVVLSGLPATGTWTLYENGTSIGTGTGTTKTIVGLAPGSYTYTVGGGTCLSAVSSNVLINPLPLVATYNGTWTNGPPSIEQSIIFAGNYTSFGNLEGCDCTVNAGVKVTVKSNHVLKITNAVKVNAAAGTSLTFENNASLVQVNNVANSGNIIYERETAPIKQYDYTYWSSPVLNQKLIDVSPDTDYDKFYSFNAVIDNWKEENPQDFMQRGIGYIIRAPENIAAPPSPVGVYKASFVGVPFNGPLSITGIIQDRSYLLGNPYPSSLDADKFLTSNSSVLDGTLYFWTHNTAIGIGVSNPGSGVYAYSSDDYATYNLTGGVGTGIGNSINNVEQTINKPTGKIAAGQAFFTSSKLNPTATVIDFNNSMRLDVNGAIMNNSQFFKVKNTTKKTDTIEKHRVWLNLTNTQGAFKQMLVGYLTGATNGYDSSFDGPSYNGNEFIDFYSISDGEFLAIQGRALPFEENDVVPLGYSSEIEGDFSISIDEVDGLLVGQNIYLEDKLNNSIHNLTKEAYTFETTKGTFDDRFVLRYTDKTLGVKDFDTTDMQVLVSVKNKQLKINSSVESIDKVFIYDVLGKQLYEKINVENKELIISNLGSSEQVLIVKTVLQNGIVVTAKTIY